MTLPDITSKRDVRDLVRAALREDMGQGDVTSETLVAAKTTAKAFIVSRASTVLAGVRLASYVFKCLDPRMDIRALKSDSQRAQAGEKILLIEGNARDILAAERVALNFLQRMSGIATLTRRFVEAAGPRVRILDTRKTTPTLRTIEKYAVRCGGGKNHRMGLFDMVLVKDNHRAIWKKQGKGGLAGAVEALRRRHPGLLVEVEIEKMDELNDVVRAHPDWILADNRTPAQLRTIVQRCSGHCKIEASGGITLRNVAKIAATGVDAISIGALTHSVPAADFSLEFEV
ncbi:MAG TPA: carboxylating nicotinate-nucleotide diphosphorylase [Kiritimatiellia bacterium]|nr:carboxylating nicotinate-nucleotide diphosphorylase [Kiritimatiellia bacterium]